MSRAGAPPGSREQLVRARGEDWTRLGALLDKGERARGVRTLDPSEVKDLSELYRSLAGDLMRVRRDRLGADLERHLDNLAARAHNLVYAQSRVGNRFRLRDLVFDFPGAVRRNVAFFMLSTFLFYGPGFAAGFAAYADESYALAVMDGEHLDQMEKMYRDAEPGTRNEDTNAAMTGFYVQNNVGIAFRCFATGLLFGLGSMFYLLFNGVVLGCVFGHLHRVGLGEKLMTFVASHSAWELTAIVIAGAAGMQMGWALVKTGGRTRIGNLQAHGLEVLRQIVGAAIFLLIAAGIEAWLSPSGLPAQSKYTICGLGFVIVFTLLFGTGRGRRIPEDVVRLRESRAEDSA